MKKLNIILLLSLFSIAVFAQLPQVKQLNSSQTKALIKENAQIVILDVRTPGEFADGHIEKVVNMDINHPDFYNQINKLDKKKTYLVYCRTKNRSGVATNYMINNGFANVYQYTGGMSLWMQEGNKTVK